jgi:hypothetical protein
VIKIDIRDTSERRSLASEALRVKCAGRQIRGTPLAAAAGPATAGGDR